MLESALNEWIESKNHLNINRSQTTDVLPAVPQTKSSAVTSDVIQSEVSKSNVELRTKQLLQSMSRLDSVINTKRRLQEFSKLLASNPEAIGFAVQQNAIQRVLRLNQWSNDQLIRQQSNQVLALLGHSPPPKGAGIRILSIDGGGIPLLFQLNNKTNIKSNCY